MLQISLTITDFYWTKVAISDQAPHEISVIVMHYECTLLRIVYTKTPRVLLTLDGQYSQRDRCPSRAVDRD